MITRDLQYLRDHAFSFIEWNTDDFPTDGRTVLLHDIDESVNFARYEPEAGQTLKIVSALGATRLGNFVVGCQWAAIPIPKTVEITVERG